MAPLGSQTYVRQYRLKADQVSEVLDPGAETLLLQTPLEVGNRWETRWYDTGAVGAFTATVEITHVSDRHVVTEIAPSESLYPGWRSGFRLEQTWTKGLGLTKEVVTRVEEDGRIRRTVRTLENQFEQAYDGFLPRYIDAKAPVSFVYPHHTGWNQVRAAEAMADLYAAADDEAVRSIFDAYAGEQTTFDPAAIDLLIRVGTVTQAQLSEPGGEEWVLRRIYDQLKGMASTFQIPWGEDHEQWGRYTEVFPSHWSPIEEGELTPEEGLVRRMVDAYGLCFHSDEGFPFFSIGRKGTKRLEALTEQEGTLAWLALVGEEGDHGQYLSDACLTLSWEEWAERLGKLDAYLSQYPEHWGAEGYAQEYERFKAWLLQPGMWMENQQAYNGPFIDPGVFAAQQYYIERYPTSGLTPIMKTFTAYYQKEGLRFSRELNEQLKAFGVDVEDGAYIMTYLREHTAHYEELKRFAGEAQPLETPYRQVTVRTAEELKEAIGDNTHIRIVGNGIYGEFAIQGVENLVLEGDGLTDVLCTARLVLTVEDCKNITLRNLRLGHTINWYSCMDGVMAATNVEGLTIDRCVLFGCGVYGLKAVKCTDLIVENTLITECQTYALSLKGCEGVQVVNVHMTDNGVVPMVVERSREVFVGRAHIKECKQTRGQRQEPLVSVDALSQVVLDRCTFALRAKGAVVSDVPDLTQRFSRLLPYYPDGVLVE